MEPSVTNPSNDQLEDAIGEYLSLANREVESFSFEEIKKQLYRFEVKFADSDVLEQGNVPLRALNIT